MQTLDISNNLFTGAFPTTGLPQASLQTIHAHGNPLLVSSPPSTLPVWAAPTTSLMKNSASQQYSCSVLGGVGRNLVVTLDAEYYSYLYCSCDSVGASTLRVRASFCYS